MDALSSQNETPRPQARTGGTDYAVRGVAMDQPTDPTPASEGPDPEPLPLICPCGDPGHAPLWVGTAFATSGPERSLYDCPQAPTHRYGLGPVS